MMGINQYGNTDQETWKCIGSFTMPELNKSLDFMAIDHLRNLNHKENLDGKEGVISMARSMIEQGVVS